MPGQNRQHGTLTLSMDNATEYFREDRGDENRQHSLPVTLCGLDWQTEARRELHEGVPYANVYVTCSSDQPTWKCKATCALRIRSTKEDRTWRFCGDFSETSKTWGSTTFITVEVWFYHSIKIVLLSGHSRILSRKTGLLKHRLVAEYWNFTRKASLQGVCVNIFRNTDDTWRSFEFLIFSIFDLFRTFHKALLVTRSLRPSQITSRRWG